MRADKCLILCIFTLIAPCAMAHIIPKEPLGFMSGFLHPFNGYDHSLANIAVGLIATRKRHFDLVLIPIIFTASLACGYFIPAIPSIAASLELGVLASIFGLALMIYFAKNIRSSLLYSLMFLFAICHGHIHRLESQQALSFSYGLGLSSSTALIVIFGLGLGMLMQTSKYGYDN